jgi:hypothetical protein
MEGVSSTSTKVLKEKLALSSELATLKTEVEYLRTQVETNQALLADKLSLQRELDTILVELENEKRTSARALARQGKNNEQDEELIAELDALRKNLNKQERDRERAEKALQKSEVALEKSQTDFESQKRATELALQKVERASKKDEQDPQVDELRKQLAQEKQDRQKQEKEFQKVQAQMDGKHAVLDEKLNAFRTKLKSTKEKLKETETELQKAKAEAASLPPVEKAVKNPRKRLAVSADPDATIGTPGDGVPKKRTKRAGSAAVGDKSTFSITPFLNRTTSVVPDSPPPDDPMIEDDAEEEPAEATPSAAPKKIARKPTQPKAKPAAKPLAPAASSKANAKPPPRKKAPISSLEKVTEETTEIADGNVEKPIPAPTVTVTETDENTAIAAAPVLKAASRPKGLPRKSLMSFAAFTDDSGFEKKKKRKLGGSGLGKTLFDAEDDDLPAKPIPGKGIFAARSLGKALLAGKGAKGPISGGYKMMTEDGFQFSPLKKDRKKAR